MTLIVKPTTIVDAVVAGARVTTVLIGGATAVAGFLSRHDLNGLITYFQSNQFVPVAGAIAAIATFGYGMWKTWHTKKSLIALVDAVPDEIAILKQEQPK